LSHPLFDNRYIHVCGLPSVVGVIGVGDNQGLEGNKAVSDQDWAKLQQTTGKRVDFDETIQHLISELEKRPDLLDRVFGSVPELSHEDLRTERDFDEQRIKRKYSI